MIIIKLSGGLGNQMFQYACGRALAHKYKVALKLDHSFLNDRRPKPDFTFREYELSAFSIDAKINSNELKSLGLDTAGTSPYKSLFSLKRLLSGYKLYAEKGQSFHDDIFQQGPKAYISGYFQNEKYFKHISQIIRSDFSFIPSTTQENISLAKRIQNSENAVSIHIRRGDYLAATNEKIHFACTPDYYSDAISFIKQKVLNPVFFIFSADDPQWAQDNLNVDAPYELIGKQNATSGYEDMRLMSMCKHHIIANSSFSWWGAWLNPNPSKIVIAPKQWFSDPQRNTQINDIILENWVRI